MEQGRPTSESRTPNSEAVDRKALEGDITKVQRMHVLERFIAMIPAC